MKRFLCMICLVLFLSGCDKTQDQMHEAMRLRDEVLSAEKCSFSVSVTADYGDGLHMFGMDCVSDSTGQLTFEISSPETISGIRGNISDSRGNIIYEEKALYFPLMTDERLAPASAPWIFMKLLCSGYLKSVCKEEDLIHVCIDDSYEDADLRLDLWMNDTRIPVHGEICYGGRRILSLDVNTFVIS